MTTRVGRLSDLGSSCLIDKIGPWFSMNYLSSWLWLHFSSVAPTRINRIFKRRVPASLNDGNLVVRSHRQRAHRWLALMSAIPPFIQARSRAQLKHAVSQPICVVSHVVLWWKMNIWVKIRFIFSMARVAVQHDRKKLLIVTISSTTPVPTSNQTSWEYQIYNFVTTLNLLQPPRTLNNHSTPSTESTFQNDFPWRQIHTG